MHWIFGAILHATVLGVIAFFILFAAGRAEGFTALLGRLLGYWVLLLAILGLVAGVYFGMTGKRPDAMMGDHGGWMHHWGPPPGGPLDQPAPTPKKP